MNKSIKKYTKPVLKSLAISLFNFLHLTSNLWQNISLSPAFGQRTNKSNRESLFKHYQRISQFPKQKNKSHVLLNS